VAQHPSSFNFNFADVAVLHFERWFAGRADTGWCAADNDVAGRQRHGFAQNNEQPCGAEDHVAGRGILNHGADRAGLKVQAWAAQRQVAGGGEPGPNAPAPSKFFPAFRCGDFI